MVRKCAENGIVYNKLGQATTIFVFLGVG